MIFWDSSALVPLLVAEPRSGAARSLLASDTEVVAWWGTRVELRSALARREREGVLPAAEVDKALALASALEGAWTEILATEPVRRAAAALVARHDLRAADAFQLGAALVWRGDAPRAPLATYDQRLAAAARREGFVQALG